MTDLVSTPNRTPTGANAVVKFHASLNISDLDRSIKFYTALFGCGPVKHYADYAKFEVETPPIILSLKPKRACVGGPLNHLGLRVVTVEHLRAIQERLRLVGACIGQQDDVKCCYAHQTKIWVTDPDQTMWEIYVLHDDVPDWGEKDKKLKLLAPPFKALGLWGTICRAWNNKFGRKATHIDGAAAVAEHAVIAEDESPIPTRTKTATACQDASAR
jgi:catechol 2,3-dioxygenase-like lactoylglutathione lyase family enzyme